MQKQQNGKINRRIDYISIFLIFIPSVFNEYVDNNITLFKLNLDMIKINSMLKIY